jgi:hypothetical protein
MAQTVMTAGLEKPEKASSGVSKPVISSVSSTIMATTSTRIFSAANKTTDAPKIIKTKLISPVKNASIGKKCWPLSYATTAVHRNKLVPGAKAKKSTAANDNNGASLVGNWVIK